VILGDCGCEVSAIGEDSFPVGVSYYMDNSNSAYTMDVSRRGVVDRSNLALKLRGGNMPRLYALFSRTDLEVANETNHLPIVANSFHRSTFVCSTNYPNTPPLA